MRWHLKWIFKTSRILTGVISQAHLPMQWHSSLACKAPVPRGLEAEHFRHCARPSPWTESEWNQNQVFFFCFCIFGSEQTLVKRDNWHVEETFSLPKNKFDIVHSVCCECICIPVVTFIAVQLRMCKWSLGSAKWCPPAASRTFLVWEKLSIR